MPYRGLLCDLDGTLADTEPQHCTAWLEMLEEELNLHYDVAWFDQWIGTSDREVAKYLIAEHGLYLEVDEIRLAKQARFQAIVRERGKSFPGVPEALAQISGRFPLAIVTNSGRDDAEVIVPALGLDKYTEVVVTASDVANLKPAPDSYLLAAKHLKLAAKDCIAMEDSAPGGAAAKAAGCYIIGLNDRVTMADELAGDNKTALLRALALLSE
ncbi:MAG: HAD family phosphatase [Bacteroidota bacterium]